MVIPYHITVILNIHPTIPHGIIKDGSRQIANGCGPQRRKTQNTIGNMSVIFVPVINPDNSIPVIPLQPSGIA